MRLGNWKYLGALCASSYIGEYARRPALHSAWLPCLRQGIRPSSASKPFGRTQMASSSLVMNWGKRFESARRLIIFPANPAEVTRLRCSCRGPRLLRALRGGPQGREERTGSCAVSRRWHGLAATENAAIRPTPDLPSGIYPVANEKRTTW